MKDEVLNFLNLLKIRHKQLENSFYEILRGLDLVFDFFRVAQKMRFFKSTRGRALTRLRFLLVALPSDDPRFLFFIIYFALESNFIFTQFYFRVKFLKTQKSEKIFCFRFR
jgi:hypothetical protein